MLKMSRYLFLALLLPVTSFAGPLTGLYEVQLVDSCHEVLQSGTVEKITDLPTGLDMSLYLGDYAGGFDHDFQSVLRAEVGDIISRPEKRFEDMGAQAVRIISERVGNEFLIREYRYSPKLSDEEGLRQGFFARTALHLQGRNVIYTRIYGGGESYRCILKKISN